MLTLLRFAARTLASARLRALTITIILSVQAGVLGGSLVAQRSLLHTRAAWTEALQLADLEVQYRPASDEELRAVGSLASIPGVTAVSRRFVARKHFDPVSRGGAAKPLPVVVYYVDPEERPVDDVAVLRGRGLARGRPEEALVDRAFAASHGIAIGDEIVLDREHTPERLRVVGIALSPEHLVEAANPEILVPTRGSLGVVYASRELVDRRFPERLTNDLCFRFAEGADRRATTDAVLRALDGLEIDRVTPRAANFGERYVDVMLGGARVMTPVVASMAALLAGVVVFLAMHRFAVEKRREVGCLVGLGFTSRGLAIAFAAVGLAPALAGALVGVPVAMLFGTLLARTSARVSGFPEPSMVFALADLGLGAAIAILVGAFASTLPVLSIARTRPAHLMRGAREVRFGEGALGRAVDRALAFAERLPPPLRIDLGPSLRYGLRNVLRRPRVGAAVVALVAFAICLPAALLSALSSWRAWAEREAASGQWDAVATFKTRLDDEAARAAVGPGTRDHEGYVQGYARIDRASAEPEQARVRGISAESRVAPFRLAEGRAFARDDAAEIVLNAGFLQGRPPPRIGETVELTYRQKTQRLLVVGLVADAGLSTAWIPIGTSRAIFGPKVSGLYFRIDRDASGASPASEAAALVTTVQRRADLADATMQYLASFHAVLLPFVGLTALLALVFLLGVVDFLVRERDGEYAALRAQGYEAVDIAKSLVVEIGALGAAGLVAAVLAWIACAWALRAAMAEAWFHVPLELSLADFATVAAPTAIAVLASVAPAVRRIARLDLVQALAARELA